MRETGSSRSPVTWTTDRAGSCVTSTSIFLDGTPNPQIDEGTELNDLATRVFDAGTAARHRADDYVRTTVVLATILFLLALSQRFTSLQVRVGVLAVAGGLMLYGLLTIATFPRL
jgi:hypothetical protein